jgi:ABC-2 type transport system ATP-binding protein
MLVTENLTRKYGSFTALDSLNLTISDGELHGFVGPNGAGKTTTMRILATLLPATSGKAYVDGVEVNRDGKKIRRMVGYMPDFFGVYDGLKTWEYLDFYARCYSLGYKEREKMVDRLLEIVRLSDKKNAYIDVLSRGMKQRLCLARSLIHDPSLLILDEPASGMDPRARSEMKDILRTLRNLGKTILISSHIRPELSEMCDSLTIIDHGKLVFSGPVTDLARKMRGQAPLDIQLIRETTGEQMTDAIDLLKEFPGVTGILQPEEHLLQVDFEGGARETAALLQAMVQKGTPVADFHRAPVNLEKVFMEVTQL